MKLTDLITETLHSLTSNKVRSGLTTLGIVVGIASVIAMIAIGQGSQATIEEGIQSIGSNLLTVMPSAPGGSGQARMSFGSVDSLTREDAEALATEARGVIGVAPESSGFEQVVAGSENLSAQVLGVTEDYASVRGLDTRSGAFITDRDDRSTAKVAVLGHAAAEELFGENSEPVGEEIRVGSMRLTVVGVLEEKGAIGMTNVDSAVLLPLSTHQRYVSGSDYLSSITVAGEDEDMMDAVEDEVTRLLLVRHGISDQAYADFRMMSMSDLLSTMATITSTFTMLLAAIASISLLVGGIGIMNMMLTTVTERTREIGLRKAIGATDGDISAQFLGEAVTLTLVGGALGVVVGWAVAYVGGGMLGVAARISWDAVVLAAGVCTTIGVAFGFYPARRAARLSPIEALRYQ